MVANERVETCQQDTGHEPRPVRIAILARDANKRCACARIRLHGHLPMPVCTVDGVGTGRGRSRRRLGVLVQRLVQCSQRHDGVADGHLGMTLLQNKLRPKHRVKVSREFTRSVGLEQLKIEALLVRKRKGRRPVEGDGALWHDGRLRRGVPPLVLGGTSGRELYGLNRSDGNGWWRGALKSRSGGDAHLLERPGAPGWRWVA